MQDRKQRKDPLRLLDLDKPEPFVMSEPDPIEIASGYSISVKYAENGKPCIVVTKYGNVDTRGLRREIERSYPGATIKGLKRPKSVQITRNKRKKLEKNSKIRNKSSNK